MRLQRVRWFCTFSKRMLVRKFFWVLLCVFPILCLCLRVFWKPEDVLVRVAVYCEGDSELAKQTVEKLSEYDKAFAFYEADSSKQLYMDVENTNAECGYIFTEDYRMEDPEDFEALKGSVQVVESPSSMLTGSANELVFASFFQIYNRELLMNFLQKPGTLRHSRELKSVVADASDLFEEYNQADAIFVVTTFSEQDGELDGNAGKGKVDEKAVREKGRLETEIFVTNLFRGIFSVLLLLACFSGCFLLMQDEKNGMFLRAGARRMRFLEIVSPASLMMVSGLLGLMLLPVHAAFGRELLGIVLYALGASAYAYVLFCLVRNETMFRAMVPLLVLGALVFAPVFVDVSAYINPLRILKYLFVNSYYLDFMKM